MSARRVWALGLAAMLSPALSACDPAGTRYLWIEDFEGPLCEGAPCGWSRIAGEEGGARWEQTLPAEHGLVLRGDGVVVVARPDVVVATGASDLTLALEVVVRCDVGAALSVEIGATDRLSGELQSFTPRVTPLVSWLEPRPTAARFGTGRLSIGSIDSISLTKTGEGACEVDFIGVIDTSFIEG